MDMGKNGVSLGRRIRTNVGVIIVLLAAMTALVLVSVTHTFAADTNAANTLKVSPVRSDIEVPAGTTKTQDVTVVNLTAAPITVRPIENDFVAGDERGTPALILDADKYAPTHSLKRFMAPLKDVTIPAKQGKTITVTITVPKDAQTGGYFGAIRFAPTNPDGGGQVNLSGSVASLILMTVPGPATEKVSLTNFDIQQKGTTGTYFRDGENLTVLARFKNEGSVQEGVFGKVSVKKGNDVVYSADFNNKNPRDMVLPDSVRRWDIPLKSISGFGHYTVYGTFTYGAKNQTIEVTRSFWVIPLFVIIAAAALLIVFIVLIVVIILVIRARKKRVKLHNHRSGGNNFRIK